MTTRQTLQERLHTSFSHFDYEALVQQTYTRPDSDAMHKGCDVGESGSGGELND